MIDLKTVIEKYPRNVGTRSQLSALLRDLYPSEKRSVNIALIVYDSGILSKFGGLKSIDAVLLHNFVKQLVDEFGLQEQFATEGIQMWANAYGVPISTGDVTQRPTAHSSATTHKPDVYAKPGRVNGSVSDYELERRSNGLVITKFIGFDSTDVIIPNEIDGAKVVGIGKDAYFNCKAMRTLFISDGIEFIEDGAFANCENLSKVTFPATLRRIGSIDGSLARNGSRLFREAPKGAFKNIGVTNISLPNGLTEIGAMSFYSCRQLVSVVFPEQLSKIGKNAFQSCENLVSLVFPEQLSKIDECAFNWCTQLKDITFPMSLIEIGSFAFANCTSLKEVMLNEGLTKIGAYAFRNCKSLEKILIPSTVAEIGIGLVDCGPLPSNQAKFTAYCYSGSYALKYARDNGYIVKNAANLTT